MKVRGKSKFTAYVYSGMIIMNKKIMKINFKNFKNFEKQLYPMIIKRFKCNFKVFTGFWHSVDNMKDIDITKRENDKKKYNSVKKLIKKLNA